jgi:CRP-like cAMP-binding protein
MVRAGGAMIDPEFAPEHFAHYSAGSEIFAEGQPAVDMFIVQDGQVEILKEIQGKNHRVAVLEEGDFFGEMAILEDLPRSAAARALTDCVLIRLDRHSFDQMARHNPEIPVRMLRKLCRRLRDTNPLLLDVDAEALQSSGSHKVDQETASQILPITDKLGSTARLIHTISNTEFPLALGSETYIGRYDAVSGSNPDIDLRSVDTMNTISRRHAKIVRREGEYFVREEVGSSNGTYLNGFRIPIGKDFELKDGDELQLGAVETVFRRA